MPKFLEIVGVVVGVNMKDDTSKAANEIIANAITSDDGIEGNPAMDGADVTVGVGGMSKSGSVDRFSPRQFRCRVRQPLSCNDSDESECFLALFLGSKVLDDQDIQSATTKNFWKMLLVLQHCVCKR
jgi:hypothetical protein